MIKFFFRWSRSCDLLQDRIYEFADNSEISGWLEIKTASPGFNTKYRVPGTTFQYRCSEGFELPTNENPDQDMVCEGSRRVLTDDIVSCVRKLQHIHFDNIGVFNNFVIYSNEM